MMLKLRSLIPIALAAASALPSPAQAAPSQKLRPTQLVEQTAQIQIRNLVEPILEKYCREDCKLLGVQVNVDLAVPDEVAPGFSDIDPRSVTELSPASAKVKVLMDEKIGPVSRTKLVDLMQQYLEAIDYPVKIEIQNGRFPLPLGSAAKAAELKERVLTRFRGTMDDLFRQFCPQACLLGELKLETELVNPEEVQYGDPAEFIQDNGVALKVKRLNASILMDDVLTPEEQKNILEMARIRSNTLKNIELASKSMKFPKPGHEIADADIPAGFPDLKFKGRRGLASNSESKDTKDSKSQSNTTSSNEAKSSQSLSSQAKSENNEQTNRQERLERVERIERVESGDAVQAELQKFKVFGLGLSALVLALLVFIAMSAWGGRKGDSGIHRIIQQLTSDPTSATSAAPIAGPPSNNRDERLQLLQKRYEIERLRDELLDLFASQPKVAKQVFTRVLAEEGVETTAQYIEIFGESVVLDMLRDPSLQGEVTELMEFYAKNPMTLTEDEQLDLLKKLHNRAVAGKLFVLGSRTTHYFDFLAEMDGPQIVELLRNESLTVKAIVMTQVDPMKRGSMFAQIDDENRLKLMSELSRIDYLPKDYIHNVAVALRRKRRENPRLNTEALPGSEVLLTLLERSTADTARGVMRQLESLNPDTARTVKSKLVLVDTLKFLRDGQLLEVVLSLRHDELLQFLKGAPMDISSTILQKSPKDLSAELQEELASLGTVSREVFQNIERKILNRMKVMANEGLISLSETNERLFAGGPAAQLPDLKMPTGVNSDTTRTSTTSLGIKKVAGW